MNRFKIEIVIFVDNDDVEWFKEDIENSLREGESIEEFKITREE